MTTVEPVCASVKLGLKLRATGVTCTLATSWPSKLPPKRSSRAASLKKLTETLAPVMPARAVFRRACTAAWSMPARISPVLTVWPPWVSDKV